MESVGGQLLKAVEEADLEEVSLRFGDFRPPCTL